MRSLRRLTIVCSLSAAGLGLGVLWAFRNFLQCLAAENSRAALALAAGLCLLFVLREQLEQRILRWIRQIQTQALEELRSQCDRQRRKITPAEAASKWSRQKEQDVVCLAEAAAYPLKAVSAWSKVLLLVLAACVIDWRIGAPAVAPASLAVFCPPFTAREKFRWLSINKVLLATNLSLLVYACYCVCAQEVFCWVFIFIIIRELGEPLNTIAALQTRRQDIQESRDRIVRFLNQ